MTNKELDKELQNTKLHGLTKIGIQFLMLKVLIEICRRLPEPSPKSEEYKEAIRRARMGR